MVYVIQVCWELASRIRMELQFHPDPVRKLSTKLYDIYHCCLQWKTPDDGQRNSAKPVEFHSKNKFEKLVHLVGFIIRNLTRCRSHECQTRTEYYLELRIYNSLSCERQNSILHTVETVEADCSKLYIYIYTARFIYIYIYITCDISESYYIIAC